MKTCPHYAESVQDEAQICKHCRRRIGPVPGARAGVALVGLFLLLVFAWPQLEQLASLTAGDWVLAVGSISAISAVVVGLFLLLFGGPVRKRLVGLAFLLATARWHRWRRVLGAIAAGNVAKVVETLWRREDCKA